MDALAAGMVAAGHFEQVGRPSELNSPGGHRTHWDDPVALAIVPAGHGLHLTALRLALYVPGWHRLQVVIPPTLDQPGWHCWHDASSEDQPQPRPQAPENRHTSKYATCWLLAPPASTTACDAPSCGFSAAATPKYWRGIHIRDAGAPSCTQVPVAASAYHTSFSTPDPSWPPITTKLPLPTETHPKYARPPHTARGDVLFHVAPPSWLSQMSLRYWLCWLLKPPITTTTSPGSTNEQNACRGDHHDSAFTGWSYQVLPKSCDTHTSWRLRAAVPRGDPYPPMSTMAPLANDTTSHSVRGSNGPSATRANVRPPSSDRHTSL